MRVRNGGRDVTKGDMENSRMIVRERTGLVERRGEDQDRWFVVTVDGVRGAMLINTTVTPWPPG